MSFERQIRNEAIRSDDRDAVEYFHETELQKIRRRKNPVKLEDAFELAMQRSMLRRISPKQRKSKKSYWEDFVAYMKFHYPKVEVLSEVTKLHAREYMVWIRENGRFLKVEKFIARGRYMERRNGIVLGNRTANQFQMVCGEIFRLLSEETGILKNPFEFPKLPNRCENRDAFSREELDLIFRNCDSFTGPLFLLAIRTGLREGDICTLRWNEISFENHTIRRRMNKTGNLVEIPFDQSLEDYLKKVKRISGNSEYVFPEHAALYQKRNNAVSYRVKRFLKGIGIKTNRVPQGRVRSVSVKDLHSCRHTFCYYAGMAGIPLSTIQAIVGHLTPEMTQHYSAHATLEDKRKAIEVMPIFLKLGEKEEGKPVTDEIHRLMTLLPSEEAEKVPGNAQ